MLKKTLLLALALLALLVPAALAAHGHKGPKGQETIALPPEFRPEGIASGPHSSFYAGSIPRGSVFRGSYRTGQGAELVPPHPGRSHTGLKVDRRFHRLFVAGADSKGIYVYDSRSGADVASFPVPDSGFINDVVLTKRAAYFTDSQVKQLYKLPIGRHGRLGTLKTIPLSGDIQYGAGNNANGIDALHGGKTLVIVQSNTGKLFKLNPKSGLTREIALNTPVTNGDGILLHGRTLYVVQNRDDKVAVVKLRRRLHSGRVRRYLTDSRLDVPSTIAPFGKFVYAVNARFGRLDDDDDDIVRLKAR
jgi:hypothetical protein